MENQLVAECLDRPYIPDDIITNILLSLPPKDLLRFRLVCKRWRDLTSTSDFIDMKKTEIDRELEPYLPAMAETFRTSEFPHYRFFAWCEPQGIAGMSFEEALKLKPVATCFWFLLTKGCPLNIKKALISVLQFILYIAPKATDMAIVAKEERVVDAQRMSIDQVCIDSLMVDALCSGDMEIIRQVCEAIHFVVGLRSNDAIGTGIQNELVKLARRFPYSRESRDATVAVSILTAINIINSESKDGFMREKLFEAVLSDRQWLLNIIEEGYYEVVLVEAYEILEGITRVQYDDDLWVDLLYQIVPAILERDDNFGERLDLSDIGLVTSAAMIISNTINKTSSTDEIESLALETDCVPFLVSFLGLRDDGDKSVCMEAIEKILKADDDESEHNKFAKMIGERRYLLVGDFHETVWRVDGWYLLYNNAPNSKSLLSKYAPGGSFKPPKINPFLLYN